MFNLAQTDLKVFMFWNRSHNSLHSYTDANHALRYCATRLPKLYNHIIITSTRCQHFRHLFGLLANITHNLKNDSWIMSHVGYETQSKYMLKRLWQLSSTKSRELLQFNFKKCEKILNTQWAFNKLIVNV